MDCLPGKSVYEYMHDCNSNRQNEIAMEYYGTKISYKEFESKIDICANALYSAGIRKGDIVNLCMLTTPETLILFYAINKMGAIVNFLVLNATQEEIHEQICIAGGTYLFVSDLAEEKVTLAAERSCVNNIICVPIAESMPLPIRILAKKNARRSKNKSWKNFLKQRNDQKIPSVETYADDLAVLEFTSGTTGESKACMLTNKAINSVAWQDNHTNKLFDLKAGQTILAALPPFLAFGLVTTLTMPLAVGMTLLLTPDPSPDNVAKLFIKYKPNHFVGGPTHLDAIIKKLESKVFDASFIVSVCCGGDKLDSSWVIKVNEWLRKCGCKYTLTNGYGLTETAATFCWETDITNYMIPLFHNNVMIIDLDTGEELEYGKEGEICLNGPSVMLGYYKHEEANSEIFFDRNGIRWMKTGDIGSVSENGAFKISGRIKRIFWGMGEDKIITRIYPMLIEETISKCKNVEKCAVVGLRNGNLGYLPIAFVVATPRTDEDILKNEIIAYCEKKLKSNSQPHSILFVDTLPTTRAGKVNFKDLEAIAKKKVIINPQNDS